MDSGTRALMASWHWAYYYLQPLFQIHQDLVYSSFYNWNRTRQSNTILPQGKSPNEKNIKSFRTYSLFQNTTEGHFPTQLKAMALAAEHSKAELWLSAGFGDWERCMWIMYWTQL